LKKIYGDETRFTQIFLNFLSNAFKFTPNNGNISVEIKPITIEQNGSNSFYQKIPNSDDFEKLRKNIFRLTRKNLNQKSSNSLMKCQSLKNDTEDSEN
jgi:signal transduction histidine kinase